MLLIRNAASTSSQIRHRSPEMRLAWRRSVFDANSMDTWLLTARTNVAVATTMLEAASIAENEDTLLMIAPVMAKATTDSRGVSAAARRVIGCILLTMMTRTSTTATTTFLVAVVTTIAEAMAVTRAMVTLSLTKLSPHIEMEVVETTQMAISAAGGDEDTATVAIALQW